MKLDDLINMLTIRKTLPVLMTLQEIREISARAHAGQRYGSKPYTAHLDDVRSVLKEFGFSEEREYALHAAAEIHDVFEDTGVSPESLIEQGVPLLAVYLATLVTDEPGLPRAERKRKTYTKIATSRKAAILKLADRLANVRNGAKNDMYRREHPEFKRALYNPDHKEAKPLWDNIEIELGLNYGSV